MIKLDVRKISIGSTTPSSLARIFGDTNGDAHSSTNFDSFSFVLITVFYRSQLYADWLIYMLQIPSLLPWSSFSVQVLYCCLQCRRSVVKSEGVRVTRVKAIRLEADRNSLLFSAPKMGYLVIFGFFCFRPKMNIHFCFIFRFRSKNVICVGPKMLCLQLNHN